VLPAGDSTRAGRQDATRAVAFETDSSTAAST
jgi:hypothetical protein